MGLYKTMSRFGSCKLWSQLYVLFMILEFDCMCKNGGRCHQITGDCICKDGYYGTKCEIFDQCRRIEKENEICVGGITFCL